MLRQADLKEAVMRVLIVSAAVAAMLLATAVQTATRRFSGTLSGASEVPANATTGKGQVDATLDPTTKTFTWTVKYSGLSGAPTMAHFHGPAAAGVNAPPVITVTNLGQPMTGSQVLTDAQIMDLMGGKWYFNIHTAAHPGGELRGQLAMR
jgi:hypothetical protein